MTISIGIGILVLLLIILAVYFAWRRHKSLKGQYSEINRLYQNSIARDMQQSEQLTDDDKQFLQQLAAIIDKMSENGVFDVGTIAMQMHISILTLRRRLSHTQLILRHKHILCRYVWRKRDTCCSTSVILPSLRLQRNAVIHRCLISHALSHDSMASLLPKSKEIKNSENQNGIENESSKCPTNGK